MKVENYGESYYMSDCKEVIKERGGHVAICHGVLRGQVLCHIAGTKPAQQSQPVTKHLTSAYKRGIMYRSVGKCRERISYPVTTIHNRHNALVCLTEEIRDT